MSSQKNKRQTKPPCQSPLLDEALMTKADFEELDDLEAKIKDIKFEMGWAFAEIKEKQLYRRTKDGKKQTWEQYCLRIHGWSKQYVDKLIRAATVVRNLKAETKVSALPANPSQAAELDGLEPGQMVEASEEAVATAHAEGRNPTAKDYKEAATKRWKKAVDKVEQGNGTPPQPPQKQALVAFGIKVRVPVNDVAPIRRIIEEAGLSPILTTKGNSPLSVPRSRPLSSGLSF